MSALDPVLAASVATAGAGAKRLLAAALVVLASASGCRPPVPVSPPVPRDIAPAWLEVEIRGLASSDGRVAVALFDSAAAFAAGSPPLRRDFLTITGESCLWSLARLPAGDYAVKAFHDRDGGGELDANALGVPIEPYGFSNDARGSFGPPSWERARFRLASPGRRIAITLR